MNNELQIFKNDIWGNIRGLEINGGSWLVGKDTAESLGYNEPNKAIVRHVDEDDRMKYPIIDNLGRKQDSWIINESGLYSLILSSKLPNAKQFKRWVISEVLPQIRKTGGYIPIEEEMSDAEIMARALQISQRTIEQKDKLLKAKDEEIQRKSVELESKNKFINQIAVSQNSIKVAEVAQIASKNGIKIGQNKLWEKLREWELIKKNSKYDPKQEYINRGYFEVVEGTKENSKGVFTYKTTRVLGKGQVYIINRLLKESGIKV